MSNCDRLRVGWLVPREQKMLKGHLPREGVERGRDLHDHVRLVPDPVGGFVHPLVAPLGAFRVQGSGFRVQGSGFRVQGSGFRVQGSRSWVQGSGFRVQGEER